MHGLSFKASLHAASTYVGWRQFQKMFLIIGYTWDNWSILPQPQSSMSHYNEHSLLGTYLDCVPSTLWKTAWKRTPRLQYFSAPLLSSVLQSSWLSSLLLVKILLIPTQWAGMKSLEDWIQNPLDVLILNFLVTKYVMMKPTLKNANLIMEIAVMVKMILVCVQSVFATHLGTWLIIHSSMSARWIISSNGT